MADEANAELESALSELEGGSTQTPETSGTPAETTPSTSETREAAPKGTETPTEESAEELFAEVAGRKYKTKEDLFKSHEAAVRELQNERSWAKPWRAYEKALRTDPELYRWLTTAEKRYHEARARGASPRAAAAATGLNQVPKELQQKIEAMDRELAEVRAEKEMKRLDREADQVKAQYKLDDAAMKKVYTEMHKVALQGWEISPDEAYWRIQAREGREAFAKTKTELDRVKADATDAGRSSTGGAPAKARVKTKADVIERGSDAEFNAALEAEADRLQLKEIE